MKTLPILFLIGLVLCVGGPVSAGGIGELNLSIGGIFPQGNYAQFADPGFTGNFRLTFRVPGLGFAAGWVDGNFSHFSSDETYVEIIDDPYFAGADQRVSEYAVSLHGGLQIGADTRRGFFRPRVALGPGVYGFQTETVLTIPDVEEPLSDETESQWKLGWRGMAGVDLFFVTKWGLSFDFTYDHVLSLDHVDEYREGVGVVRTGRTARYLSYSIGVTIPLSTLNDDG
ncbi:MAG: hypothetical protein OEV49_16115 [candidate division Zixibacteria bacterium]|nr:hypothetical protein [candidate division Zixibacteria bacterium]MDH3938357.1 hypothetical protein [candidate division Zixibacteria bacterium]MDH4032712.1 hypothetical protein [candidate division Zixibacteria bacterium]